MTSEVADQESTTNDRLLHSRPVSYSPFRVHLALTAVAVLFSLNYIISKVALGTFTPLTFAYLRVIGSAAILSVAVRPGSRFEPLDRKDRWRLAGYSMLGVVVNQVLFLTGLALTSAHVAAIVMTMIPIFALAAAIAMSLERATAAKVGGISMAFAGALLVVGTEGLAGSTRSMVGVLLLIGNSLSYSMYLVVSKPAMRRLVPQRVIAQMFGMASILMIPICAPSLLHERWATIPARSWVALVAVILGPTVGAYLLNAWALARAESSLVATYTYLQPFITTILAALFLRETVRPIVIAAAILIFAGVYLSGRPAPPAARPEAVPGNPD